MTNNQVLIPCELCNLNIHFEEYTDHLEHCFIHSVSNNYVHQTIRRFFFSDQINQDNQNIQAFFGLNNNNQTSQIVINSNIRIPLSGSVNETLNVLPLLFDDDFPNSYETNLQLQDMYGGDVLIPLKKKNSDIYSFINFNAVTQSCDEDISCAICLEQCHEKNTDTVFVKTICNHIYCKLCIDKWFKKRGRY